MADSRKERIAKIAGICKTINKGSFGGEDKNACTYFSSDETTNIQRISSGSIALDTALGGGYPRGRIVEIYGPESSGKSSLCLHAIAEFQKTYPDDDVAFIDSEMSWDLGYARTLGVDTDLIIVNQPENGEQALNVLRELIANGIRLIVVDSVAALTPKSEIEGDIGDSSMGTQARMMSQAMRILTAEISKTNSLVMFTNQTRSKIGVVYGNPTTTSGGNALKFYASCRIETSVIGKEKEGDVIVAVKVKAKVVKNKVGVPYKEAIYNITFGKGIDMVATIFDDALLKGVVEKSGAWFSYMGEKIGQGRLNALETIRSNQAMLEEIKAKATAITEIPKKAKKDEEEPEEEEVGKKKAKKAKVVEEPKDEEENTEVEVDKV